MMPVFEMFALLNLFDENFIICGGVIQNVGNSNTLAVCHVGFVCVVCVNFYVMCIEDICV